MNRREALRSVALILGGTVISGPAFLSGCQPDSSLGSNSQLLSGSDIGLLDEIAETIIPATETPGAKAAGVGRFMAKMVADCYSKKQQKTFREGINKMRIDFESEFHYSFKEAQPDERLQFLNKLDTEMQMYYENKNNEDPEHYFRMIKELVLLGYFTSEAGCTLVRRYQQTPGRYEACIDYSEGEKAWTTP